MAATDERKARTVRMDQDLRDRIDAARGLVPFEVWAREAFELAMLPDGVSDELVEKLWRAERREDIRRVLRKVVPR